MKDINVKEEELKSNMGFKLTEINMDEVDELESAIAPGGVGFGCGCGGILGAYCG